MFIYIDFRAKRGKFRVKAEMHVHIYRFDEKLIEIKGRFENYVHILRRTLSSHHLNLGRKNYVFGDFVIATSTPDTLDTSEMNHFRSRNILVEEKDRLENK